MARIKIELPEQFHFSTQIPVSIHDINYAGHLGNDALLSLLHEARLQYLRSFGCSEMDACGVGLIIVDVAIVYKSEGFHGDLLRVEVTAGDFSSRGFDLFYRISCERKGQKIRVAKAKTGMLCFDYNQRKTVSMPSLLKEKLEKH